MYHCGIDIGEDNMAFSFMGDRTIITYLGSNEKMTRFEIGHELFTIEPHLNKTAHDSVKLIAMLDSIKEFAMTKEFIIESQMNNKTCARMDGIIYGYLVSKGITGAYMGGQARKNFAIKATEDVPISQKEIKDLIGKQVKENKLSSIGFVRKEYSHYLTFVVMHTKKIDDICDAIVYAHMSVKNMANAKNRSKMLVNDSFS
jgi:hypothetical protein